MSRYRVLTGPDAKRPKEPALERLFWMLTQQPGVLDVNMEAVDYRGQTSREVLDDILEAHPRPEHQHDWTLIVGWRAYRLPVTEQYLVCACGARRFWGPEA